MVKAATDLYGANSPEVQEVKMAWMAVGCLPSPNKAMTPIYLAHEKQLGLALDNPTKLKNGNVVQKYQGGEIVEQPNGKIAALDTHGRELGHTFVVANDLSKFVSTATDAQKHHISKDLGAPISPMEKMPNGNYRLTIPAADRNASPALLRAAAAVHFRPPHADGAGEIGGRGAGE